MHPVLAHHEIQVLEQRRQQTLAAAERDRLVRTHVPASRPGPRAWCLRRALLATLGAVARLVPFGDPPAVAAPHDTATVQP